MSVVLFVRVYTLKKGWCYYLQSLFSFSSVSIVFLSVIVVLSLSERDRKERKRELYHFYSLFFFIRVRPVCPSFNQYLYTYARTHSHTNVISDRSIKKLYLYSFVHLSFDCAWFVICFFFAYLNIHIYLSFLSIIILVLFSPIFYLYFVYSNDNNDDNGQDGVLIYLFKFIIVHTSKQILSMFMRRTSWFLFLFFIVLSITTNIENDSNDDIELTSGMWVSSLTKQSIDIDPRQMLTVTKDRLLLSHWYKQDQRTTR